MDSSSFSIITVVKDNPAGLEKTVKEFFHYKIEEDFEYIVVYGDSSDETKQVIERYSHHIDNIIIQEKSGIANAFNLGIEAAQNDIIIFLHAGDTLRENTLKEIDRYFFKNTSVDILCSSVKIRESKGSVGVWTPKPKYLNKWMTVPHTGVFVKRKVYHKIGNFKENYKVAMDFEWLYRARTNGIYFGTIDKVFSTTCLDGNSSRFWRKGYKEVKDTLLNAGESPLDVLSRYALEIMKKRIILFMMKHRLLELCNPFRKMIKPI